MSAGPRLSQHAFSTRERSTGIVAAFAVLIEPEREVIRVVPVGELDLCSTPVLARSVDDVLESGFDQVSVDLRHLSFMDLRGVGYLLKLGVRARTEGWQLSVVPGLKQVERVLLITDSLSRLPVPAFRLDGPQL